MGNTKAWVDTKTNGQKELSLVGHTHSYAASTHTHTKAQITDFPTTMTPSSHSHAASDITSGTLPITRGGTGAATATANYVFAAPNGSNGAPAFRKLVAADIPSLAASKITSGTLPVARGGTGVTTIDALKSALGIVSGGCKMAYGSGVSLSGLDFTPYVAILIGQYSSSVTGYYTWVAIKGYDTDCKLCCVIDPEDSSPVYCRCTFSTSGVTFSKFNSNFRFYDYDAYICAFGM